jgi:hypothetical protein
MTSHRRRSFLATTLLIAQMHPAMGSTNLQALSDTRRPAP